MLDVIEYFNTKNKHNGTQISIYKVSILYLYCVILQGILSEFVSGNINLSFSVIRSFMEVTANNCHFSTS